MYYKTVKRSGCIATFLLILTKKITHPIHSLYLSTYMLLIFLFFSRNNITHMALISDSLYSYGNLPRVFLLGLLQWVQSHQEFHSLMPGSSGRFDTRVCKSKTRKLASEPRTESGTIRDVLAL